MRWCSWLHRSQVGLWHRRSRWTVGGWTTLDTVRSSTSQVACDVQSQWWRVVHAALFPVLRARGTMRADQTFEAKWSGNNAVPVDRPDERQRDHRGSYWMRTSRPMMIASVLVCGTSAMAGDIAPGGRLRAAYLGTNPAQAMRDPATGEIRGPAYDLTRELARRNNVSLEFKPIAGPPAIIEAVKNGQADIG